MYAIVTTVSVDTTREADANALLANVVVPAVKATAGLAGAYWARTADHSEGMSVELYESEVDAQAAFPARQAGPPPGAPVTVTSVRLMEVVATA